MMLMNGQAQILALPEDKQQQFERFFAHQTRFRLLPLFTDFSVATTIIGTLFFVLSLAHREGKEAVGFALFLYIALLLTIGLCHRYTRLREASPLTPYLIFIVISIFAYLGYFVSGGAVATLIGLYFYLSSIGFVTMSLRHTLVIVAINVCFQVFSVIVTVPREVILSTLLEVFTHWFIVFCMVLAPLFAVFTHWLMRNILALQFLLHDRNKLLAKTLQSLKETEQQLIQQQKHQALSHMAKGLLHEIMNPVNCSAQALAYAKSISDDEELTEAIDDAMINQNRIAAIVDDLIEFSSSEPEQAKELVDIVKLMNMALRVCRSELKDISVENHLSGELMFRCYGASLLQVFVNLLLNASNALSARKQSGEARIDLGAKRSDSGLEIWFEDNGKGIAKEKLERLTEPFYTDKDSPNHLGLGLSICQTIIGHHQGQMRIESEQAEWTRVSIFLP